MPTQYDDDERELLKTVKTKYSELDLDDVEGFDGTVVRQESEDSADNNAAAQSQSPAPSAGPSPVKSATVNPNHLLDPKQQARLERNAVLESLGLDPSTSSQGSLKDEEARRLRSPGGRRTSVASNLSGGRSSVLSGDGVASLDATYGSGEARAALSGRYPPNSRVSSASSQRTGYSVFNRSELAESVADDNEFRLEEMLDKVGEQTVSALIKRFAGEKIGKLVDGGETGSKCSTVDLIEAVQELNHTQHERDCARRKASRTELYQSVRDEIMANDNYMEEIGKEARSKIRRLKETKLKLGVPHGYDDSVIRCLVCLQPIVKYAFTCGSGRHHYCEECVVVVDNCANCGRPVSKDRDLGTEMQAQQKNVAVLHERSQFDAQHRTKV